MILNNKIPGYLFGKYQLLGTVTFSVLFAIVLLVLYIPFSETAWFGLGDSIMFAHTIIFAAISMLTLIFSRMLMYRSKRIIEHTFISYILWCILEIVLIAAFYTALTLDIPLAAAAARLSILGRALKNGARALGIP